MTTVVLICGPLFLVLGALYWVLSFSKEQAEFNAVHWKKHGAKT